MWQEKTLSLDLRLTKLVCDELKSHLFLVHFSACFSHKKGQLLCRNMKKLTNSLLAGRMEESRKMQQ